MTVLNRTMQFMAMHIQLSQTMLCKDFILKVVARNRGLKSKARKGTWG